MMSIVYLGVERFSVQTPICVQLKNEASIVFVLHTNVEQ
jgi:hypothetical protein